MDLDALNHVFSDPAPKRSSTATGCPTTPAPAEPEPRASPAALKHSHSAELRSQTAEPEPSAASADPQASPSPSNREAREERAAIMEYDGGLARADAEAAAARLHPDPPAKPATGMDTAGPWYGYTRADLAAIEPDLWPEIEHHPETLQAFARALSQNPNAPRPSEQP